MNSFLGLVGSPYFHVSLVCIYWTCISRPHLYRKLVALCSYTFRTSFLTSRDSVWFVFCSQQEVKLVRLSQVVLWEGVFVCVAIKFSVNNFKIWSDRLGSSLEKFFSWFSLCERCQLLWWYCYKWLYYGLVRCRLTLSSFQLLDHAFHMSGVPAPYNIWYFPVMPAHSDN